MARPSGPDIEEALALVRDLVEQWHVFADRNRYVTVEGAAKAKAEHAKTLRVLREAVRYWPVWPSKEVAKALGIDSANLQPDKEPGLPEPVQRLPRPTARHPDRVMRLWDAGEIEEFAARRRAERNEREVRT